VRTDVESWVVKIDDTRYVKIRGNSPNQIWLFVLQGLKESSAFSPVCVCVCGGGGGGATWGGQWHFSAFPLTPDKTTASHV